MHKNFHIEFFSETIGCVNLNLWHGYSNKYVMRTLKKNAYLDYHLQRSSEAILDVGKAQNIARSQTLFNTNTLNLAQW